MGESIEFENMKADMFRFMEEMDKFSEMADDFSLSGEDYYKAFTEMYFNYDNHSLIPYSVYRELLQEEYPAEEYFLKMLVEMYCRRDVGNDFLEVLEETLEVGDNQRYIEQVLEQIKDYIHDGYITLYRGEYATEYGGNLDYKESVSYSLVYRTAKHFATRFKEFGLTKSKVYTVKVPVEDVIGFNDREDEVVCRPIALGGKMEVVNEEIFV